MKQVNPEALEKMGKAMRDAHYFWTIKTKGGAEPPAWEGMTAHGKSMYFQMAIAMIAEYDKLPEMPP